MKHLTRPWLIYGEMWKVVFKQDLGKDTLGLCDHSNKTLYIKTGQKRKEALKTLIHEVLHAFEDEYEIVLGHKVINKLEDPLANFFLENFWGN